MRGRKNTVGKIYPKYQPYPLSWDFEGETYTCENAANSEPEKPNGNHPVPENSHDLIADSSPPDWLTSRPIPSNDETPLRPLRLLRSLFADRLDFLQRALHELESAKRERQQLVRYALDELDSEISQCDRSIATLKAAFNNTEQQRHIERRLLDLKRDRRREALLSWRDLVWLKGEIRKLRREIDSLRETATPAENNKGSK